MTDTEREATRIDEVENNDGASNGVVSDGDVNVEVAEDDVQKSEQDQLLPVLPLRGTVVFPLTVVPLAAAQARSLRLIDDVMSGDRTVGLILQNDAEMEGAGPDDVRSIGTVGSILQMMRVPDGSVRLAVQ